MSTFCAPISRVRAVEAIPKADRIELAVVGDYRSVVPVGSVQPGDLVGYLPEGALLPDWLLQRLGLWNPELGMGVLSGPEGRRISPRVMRNTLTEGIVVPLRVHDAEVLLDLADGQAAVVEGQDVADLLGLTKWRPPIAPQFQGRVELIHGFTFRFDIEDRKSWPDVILEGEMVSYTEKLHGVFMAVGVVPGLNNPNLLNGDTFVSSKQLFGDGLVFSDTSLNGDNNYVRALESLQRPVEALRRAAGDAPIYVAGELFGLGVQRRFAYGQKRHSVRCFDVYQGMPHRGRWLGVKEKREFLQDLGFAMVDTLYEGPHDLALMRQLRSGPSVTGAGAHIREGLVITPMQERRDPGIGRVILKEVSPAYLKGTDGSELS